MASPKVLPEVRIILERLQPGERAIELDPPDNIGHRTKLGGEPDFIQPGQKPMCRQCRQTMTFIAQIDSIDGLDEYTPAGIVHPEENYMFGDAGMIYVYLCFECLEAVSEVQCY
ncbi:MAG: hypothetical protein M3Y56_03355 [Armatimonadota bacterium]|nr:hypothetical protein [Armatimonadota bacterium]